MYKQISIDEAHEKIESQNVGILDIRDINSYQAAHIENAEHITADNFDEFCDHTDKSKPLIIYCYHGISSQAAAKYLVDEGFTNVYSIIGGFEAWRTKYEVSFD